METNEKLIFSNSFGSVTDKRVILNYKSGTEDILLNHISTVSYQHERNYFFAIGGFLLSVVVLIGILSNLSSLDGTEVLIMLLFVLFSFLSGLANWIGHHNIVISVGGKNRKPLKAELSKTREGKEFVKAIKGALLR
ncbi:MAG: hypothetical protein Q8K02_08960 [Flavobacterium sp.]|nr:hypothetical protein [Flavobacterium sp.]